MRSLRTVIAIPLFLAAASSSVALGSQTMPAAAASAPSLASTVKLAHSARFGQILANRQGLTLYYLTADKAGRSTCYGQCTQYWFPLLAKSSRLGRSHLPGKLASITRSGASRQVTYNGWPLYTFASDRRPGDVLGQGVAGQWFVATPTLKRTGAAPAPQKARQPAPPAGYRSPAPTGPPSMGCIPEGNGGDQDGDNNGSPSDGDGCQ